MVNQMSAQAEFTVNAKVIAVADETIGTILDVKS
jgi:flagellar hook protein FlgE